MGAIETVAATVVLDVFASVAAMAAAAVLGLPGPTPPPPEAAAVDAAAAAESLRLTAPVCGLDICSIIFSLLITVTVPPAEAEWA